MLRRVPDRRGLAASLLALSLVTTLSLGGCGTDAATAPEKPGGNPQDIGGPLFGDEQNTPKDNDKKMEDGSQLDYDTNDTAR
ncbi:MAG TPA: hypothetical protein VF720_08200 [Candidatus Eisenbacteria bacterium]